MPPSADDAPPTAGSEPADENTKRSSEDQAADGVDASATKKAKLDDAAQVDEAKLAETHAFGKLILFGEHFVVYKVPAYVGAVAAYTDCSMEVEELTEGDAAKPELEIVDNRPAVPNYKVKKFDEAKEAITQLRHARAPEVHQQNAREHETRCRGKDEPGDRFVEPSEDTVVKRDDRSDGGSHRRGPWS